MQIGGFLIALGDLASDPKIVGACAQTMTDHATPIVVEGTSVDIVGTGGDGLVSCTPPILARAHTHTHTQLLLAGLLASALRADNSAAVAARATRRTPSTAPPPARCSWRRAA